MFGRILSYLYWYLRPLIKWFLRKTTGLCELQRICYGEPSGAPRVLGVESSLRSSRSNEIRDLLQYLDNASYKQKFGGTNEKDYLQHGIYTVIRVKRINVNVHKRFPILFGKCIEQIWGYRQLFEEVEVIRTTQYDCENPDHEIKLQMLWNLLMPNEKLEARISKQWQDIGFQGDDPKTDFRGMGMLGLENLLYFAKEYPGPAGHVLSHSHHPSYGYAFAIVGINLTSMTYHLFKDNAAKVHIYNISRRIPTMKLFHELYCYLFYEFDRYWIESKPRNMMDFSRIQEEFESNIRGSLTNPMTVFKMNVLIDII